MTDTQRTARDLVDVLQRHGFVRCDIAACNCGSWHPRYGYQERFQEIQDALQEADVELNGVTLLQAVKNVITERDEAKRLAVRQANEIRRLRHDLQKSIANHSTDLTGYRKEWDKPL